MRCIFDKLVTRLEPLTNLKLEEWRAHTERTNAYRWNFIVHSIASWPLDDGRARNCLATASTQSRRSEAGGMTGTYAS